MLTRFVVFLAFGSLGTLVWSQGENADLLLSQAKKAVAEQKLDDALALLDRAVKLDGKLLATYQLRGRLRELRGQYAEALADLQRQFELDPKDSDLYHHRGVIHFKMGKIKESVADYDRFLELQPDRKPSHWQRGISFYYAGQYEDGRRQFEGYQDFDSNDIENALWRFMCMTRAVGMDRARKDMLKIGPDKRVPMREIYELYLGKIQPRDVMTAATAGDLTPAQRSRHLFYAHLYLGIYHDLLGEKPKALEHLELAAGEHRIGHYMGNVAVVHRDILKKDLKK